MSLDLYGAESLERLSRMAPVADPEVGAFDGFLRGAGLTTMRGLAKTGRAIDLLGSVGPILKDAATGGTELQDRYFKEHDEVWGSAVDYWTPKPNEVGVAGQITGELLSMLPMVIASPSLAVGSLQLGTAEDLVKKGVDATRAQAVGASQAVGLGLGIWMPVLGQNLWQRVVVGGAGFNLAQGVAMRATAGMILEGTEAAKEFEAFDGKALTMDVLLGAAFGGIVHLSPAARAQGAEAWGRIERWAENLTPTEKSALVAVRLSQHLNVEAAPGVPKSPADVEAHFNRVKTAMEQMQRGQPVEVSDLPEPRFDADEPRMAEMARRADDLVKEAERARKAEGLPEQPIAEPEAVRAEETEAPAAKPGGSEPPPPRGPRAAEAAGAEANPVTIEAERLATEDPDAVLRVGTDAEGAPIVKTRRQFLDDARADVKRATEEAKLFEVAAACMLGVG